MATKADKTGKAKKTIIDVTHADSAAPSPNSKSVIVPSRPILKDPMVVDKAEEDNDAKPMAKAVEKDIPATAVTEPLASDKPSKALTVAELAETAANNNKKSEKATEEPATEPEKPTETEEVPPQKEELVDETDETLKADKSDEAIKAETAAQVKHDAGVDKLVESKQYYLPIETIEKRRSKRFVALGVLLSLLLIVAWADIALDAGLIKVNGIKPVTHFFSN
jgi:hypothetical protein